MMAAFLMILMTLGAPASSLQQSAFPEGILEHESTGSTAWVAQAQEPVEGAEEDEMRKPYEGFNVLAMGMIAITLLIVAFVVYRVFQRMSKSRKGEM